MFSGKKSNVLTPEVLSQFDDFKEKFNSSSLSAEVLAESMENIDQRIITYAKTCKNGEMTTKGFKASVEGLSFSAKAGSVALKALSIAGNMLLFTAITKGIDDLIHSTERCKERVDELMSSYQSALDKANSNAKTVEELAAKYETLSKGVNNLGKNVTLTTDEYTEYNKIVNQIADMFPTLIQGYTSEGNAILSLKGNVEELRNAYKEAQQEAYNLLIVSGEDSDGNDIIKNWSNITNGTFWQESTTEKIDYLDYLSEILETKEKLEEYQNTLVNSSGIIVSWFHDFTGLVANFNVDDLSDDDLSAIRKNVQALKQTYQAEIDSALKDVQTLANAYLMTNEDYAKLDDQSKNVASIIVNSINEGIVSGFESKEDVGAYVISIVDSIKDNPEIQDALVGLFSTDFSEKSVNETKELIDLYIKSIADTIGEDELELKIRLGFDDIVDAANRLKNSIRQITDDHGISDREESATLSEYTKDFTQEQVELWLETTRGAENAEQAIEMFKNALRNVDENPISFSDIFSLESANDELTLLGQISESIDTIQNAYKTLYNAIEEYNEEGAFSIDTLQSVIALGDDWLDYLVDEDGALKLDKESLEQLTQARLNDMRVQAINNVIDNVSKIEDDASANEYLKTTNYALAESYEEVAQKALESARAQMQAAVAAGTLSQANMNAAMNKATADIEKINKLFANTSINASSITGGSSSRCSTTKSEFSETIDFFERRVEVLDDAISHLGSTMDNIAGSFGKNNLVDAELGITAEKFNNYTDALAMYTQKANEVLSKLPADIAAKIKDGAVALTDFIGDGNKEVAESIKEYESWADKIQDCRKELAELQKEIRQLELEKFNNIMDDFQNQFDIRGDSKDLISKQIDLLKASGELIGESFFTAQIDQSRKQLEILEHEKAQLVDQMSGAISSGRVKRCPLLQ